MVASPAPLSPKHNINGKGTDDYALPRNVVTSPPRETANPGKRLCPETRDTAGTSSQPPVMGKCALR